MSNERRPGRWKWIAGLLLLACAAIFGLTAARAPSNEIDESKLVAVERGDVARSVVATGKIEPRAKVEVKSKASGIVERLFVDYGDRVRAGQVLAELDKEELQARKRESSALLAGAQAALEAARATLERNKVEARGPDVPFLKMGVDRAQRLLAEGLGARATLEDAEQAYQLALNRRMAAQSNLAVSRAEVARASAQVEQAQAALDRAQEDLRNSTITSPMDGLVLSRDVEIGDAVSSILVLGSQATLLMTLGDVSSVYVLGEVDEADIGKVHLEQPARIVVESFKDERFEGTVTKISPLGVEEDNVTTFEVRVSIDNPSGQLKANMSANAEIVLEEKLDVLLIPEAVVRYDEESNATVELSDAESEAGLRQVAVELGVSNGVKTEVVSGLDEGQRVYQP